MLLFLSILGLIAGTALLYYGADYLVRGAVILAKKAGISSLVIGLTFVAFGTSAPELVVSVGAALRGQPDICLGNVIGSNICNIGLILGLCAVIRPIPCARNLILFDIPVMIVSSLLFFGVYFICGGLDRMAGIAFFLLLFVYILFCIRRDKKQSPTGQQMPEAEGIPSSGIVAKYPILFALIFGIGGLLGLVLGADLFVKGSVNIARMLHVSEAVIGLTLVAVGTSLPELATSLVAAWKGENDIAAGNVVGSNIFNILAIMGLTPIIAPIRGNNISNMDFAVMLVLAILLLPFSLAGKRINRVEGGFFFFSYVLYVLWLIF